MGLWLGRERGAVCGGSFFSAGVPVGTAELDTGSSSGQGLQVHYMYKTTPIHTPDLLMMTVSPT